MTEVAESKSVETNNDTILNEVELESNGRDGRNSLIHVVAEKPKCYFLQEIICCVCCCCITMIGIVVYFLCHIL